MEIMSDNNLNVRATISATNEASPAIRKVIADLEKLKSVAKSFSSAFSNVGNAAFQSLDGVTRASKSAADQMRGLSNVSGRAAKSYASAWSKADQGREKSASRMYAQLMREERQYQALVAKRSAGTSPRGSGTSVRKIVGGTFLGVGAASATHQLGNQAFAAEKSIGRGIASAFRERLRVSKAETQNEIFGGLSAAEVRKLRKDSLDRLGIKFGTGAEGTLGVATELSKAGIGKQVLGDATELALKAKIALDVSEEETAKLFGGLASFIQFDKGRYATIANSIAVANKSSKASGTEIVEGMKRGLSAIATTGGKLTPEQLAGLVATGIDVGIQPGKSGNFISHLIGTVGSADTAHGKRATDLQEAAQHLGFGGRQQMAKSMRNNPMESIYQILDNLAKLPEKMKIRVAKDLGQEMWFDEILQMVLAKDKLKSMQKDIATDGGFLDKAALKAIRSMGGAYASVVATAKLAQEKIGGGFDAAFSQIADAILKHTDSFNFDSISSHVSAFVDGLRDGLGFRDWGQAVHWLASQFDSGTVATWRAWGRGFASGLKSWGESLMSAFNVFRRLTGTGDDAESTGKLAANLAVLATSLIVVNPLLLLLAGTMALLASPFALFIASVIALKKAFDWVADKMFAAFVSIVDAIKDVALSMVNKVRGWIGLTPIEGSGPSRMPGESQQDWQKRIDDYTIQRLKQPTSYSGSTDFSGRRRNADLSESFTKFAGKIERAAFMSGGNGGGLQYAALGGGSGRGISGGRSFIGGVPSIITNTPGAALPGLNRLRGNGIIRRDSIPSFTGSGGSAASGGRSGGIVAPNVIAGATPGGGAASGRSSAGKSSSAGSGSGSAGTGDAVAYAQRFKGLNEYRDNRILAAELGGDVRGKSNAWCARFVNKALAVAGGKGTDSAVANSFQRWGTGVNASDVKRNDVLLQTNGRGYNMPGGHVGMATGETRMVNGKMQAKMIAGNDSDSVREHWINVDKNLMVRRGNVGANVPHGITDAVPPSGVVQNVPPADAVSRGLTGPGMMRGGSGAQIHINGGSHDPEALATLVQRRIDESMNWRTHDTVSEYS